MEVSRKIGRVMVLLGIMVLVLVLPLAARAEETNTTIREKTTGEIQDIKERSQAEKAAIKEKRQNLVEEFRAKLVRLKDTRKQAVVERLNNRLCTINKSRTGVMAKHLERMVAILERVVERANAAKANGKDITTVERAVETAKGKIAEAKAAVMTLSQMDCAISITGSDTTVGSEVRNAIAQYEAKLKEVRAKVIAARKAVSVAIKALAAVVGERINVELKEGD